MQWQRYGSYSNAPDPRYWVLDICGEYHWFCSASAAQFSFPGTFPEE